MKKLAILLAWGLVALLGTGANAASVFVKDTKASWPGYSNSYGDVIGIPNVLGLSFAFSGHTLTGVTVDFDLSAAGSVAAWNADKLKPGDIFLDTDSDQSWDYIIHNPTNLVWSKSTATATKNSPVSSTWNVYETELGYSKKDIANTALYNMATVFETNQSNWSWRRNHPIQATNGALKNADIVETASVIWPQTATSKEIHATWNLGDGLVLPSGNTLTVGFAVSCANDVFFETLPIPNPEPATMALTGLGLAGAAWLRRRTRPRA